MTKSKKDLKDQKAVDAYEKFVSGFIFPHKSETFPKVLEFVEKGSSNFHEYQDDHAYLHGQVKEPKFKTPEKPVTKIESRKLSQSEKRSSASISSIKNEVNQKSKKNLLATLHEYNLPARPLVKGLDSQSFILENLAMDKDMCQALGQALASKGHLNTILLINNKLNDEALGIFLEQIMAEPQALKIFRCINNGFGEKFLNVFEKKFFSLGNNSLREVSLDGCIVLEKYLGELFAILSGARSRIKYLSLAKVGLGDMASKTLGRYLGTTEFLLSLDVSWNKINSKSMNELLEGIKTNQSIRHLNLSWNSLSNEDNVNARLLKKILMTSPHLIHVKVAFTGLNDSDVILIIEGAKGNKNLMSLHLGGNKITPPALERMS